MTFFARMGIRRIGIRIRIIFSRQGPKLGHRENNKKQLIRFWRPFGYHYLTLISIHPGHPHSHSDAIRLSKAAISASSQVNPIFC